jgi:hypothetical protein
MKPPPAGALPEVERPDSLQDRTIQHVLIYVIAVFEMKPDKLFD